MVLRVISSCLGLTLPLHSTADLWAVSGFAAGSLLSPASQVWRPLQQQNCQEGPGESWDTCGLSASRCPTAQLSRPHAEFSSQQELSWQAGRLGRLGGGGVSGRAGWCLPAFVPSGSLFGDRPVPIFALTSRMEVYLRACSSLLLGDHVCCGLTLTVLQLLFLLVGFLMDGDPSFHVVILMIPHFVTKVL